MISNTASDDEVRYFIVQHVADPFRREGRNVGVVVQRGGDCRARFLGETASGKLDGRFLRGFTQPEVYREWVRYWRRVCEGPPDRLAVELTRPNGAHYNVIDAGVIAGTAADPLDQVCGYAYGLLVSDGGLEEVLRDEAEVAPAQENLRRDVTSEFRRLELMGHAGLFLPNPIVTDQQFVGKSRRTHRVSFAQHNGGWTIMETINFDTSHKRAAKHHAGYTAHVFGDIKARMKASSHPIAIVRFDVEDRDRELVEYSVGLLRDQCEAIVDWDDARQRAQFLESRVEQSGQSHSSDS